MGWRIVHYIRYIAEQFSDSRDAVRAEWEHLDRPRSGQRTVEAQLVHFVRVQLSSKIEINLPNLLYTLSTMGSDKEIIPFSEAAAVLYDDTSMNGLNGPTSPIVVEPGDRERPSVEMPERAFYICAPQIYWIVAMGAEDRPARFAIEDIPHEQFRFGTQMEECHQRLIAG